MKIGFAIYYNVRDALSAIPQCLTDLGHEVAGSFPILEYPEPSELLCAFQTWVKDLELDCVLWWILPNKLEVLREIKHCFPRLVHVFYNWDEPYVWENPEVVWGNFAWFPDAIIATCESSLLQYRQHGCASALVPTLPSCDPNVFFAPKYAPKFEYDLCLVCTNMYSDKHQYAHQIVDRTWLLQELRQNFPHLRIALFGPPHLESFGDMYKGYCAYKDLCGVFQRSRLNLCTHVTTKHRGYLNERVAQVMCAGGLLLIDQMKGNEHILKDGVNCVRLRPEELTQQITRLLQKDLTQIRNNAALTGKLHFTWKNWAQKIQPVLAQVQAQQSKFTAPSK